MGGGGGVVIAYVEEVTLIFNEWVVLMDTTLS